MIRAGLLEHGLAERHLALHADQLRPVVGHVVERRGDLAFGAPPGPRRAAYRRRSASDAYQRGRPTNSTQPAAIASAPSRERDREATLHQRVPRPGAAWRRGRPHAGRRGAASRNRTMPLTSAWTMAFWNVSVATSLLLLRIREERHLDEHRRHVHADEHAERAPAAIARGPIGTLIAERRLRRRAPARRSARCGAPAPSPTA